MKYDPFIRVALTEDLPERRLRLGDVATVVRTPSASGQQSLEARLLKLTVSGESFGQLVGAHDDEGNAA